MEEQNNETLPFGYPQVTEQSQSIIKVVGVGGGGSNAVANMYREGIRNVTYLVINTDKAALDASPVPNKLQISEEGLGTGADDELGKAYAEQYEDAIRNALNDGTKMVFITAGMGKGTGTGAGPVVARIAKEMGILTIGIVTIPFRFEGQRKIKQALRGVREMRTQVDALLVINNERLIEIYPDYVWYNGFRKADDTLTNAARSISDIINKTGYQNIDFNDVKTTLKGSGLAIISTGEAEGENRVSQAIQNAINSPLLQDNNILNTQRLLIEFISSEQNPLTMAEMNEVTAFVDGLDPDINVIHGSILDDTLGDKFRIIILAAGFKMEDVINEADISPKIPIRPNPFVPQTPPMPAVAPSAPTIHATGDETDDNRTISMANADADVEIRYTLDGSVPTAYSQLYTQPFQLNASADSPTTSIVVTAIALRSGLTSAPVTRPVSLTRGAEPTEAESTESEPQPGEEPVSANITNPEPPVTVTPPAQPVTVAQPAQPVQPTPPAPAPAVHEPKGPEVEPHSDPRKGFEEISKFYGRELAEDIRMNEIRKNYYMLDENDLSNEELASALEQMPCYNRSYEQLCELKKISQAKGSQQQGSGGIF